MNKDVKYLRDMAEASDAANAQRLRDIADNLDSLLDNMVEIRGLVRVIIQNAPVILEFSTPIEER